MGAVVGGGHICPHRAVLLLLMMLDVVVLVRLMMLGGGGVRMLFEQLQQHPFIFRASLMLLMVVRRHTVTLEKYFWFS